MDLFPLFQTTLAESPDMDQADRLEAIAQQAERHRAIDRFLDGEIDAIEMLDRVEAGGTDMDSWCDAVLDNLEAAHEQRLIMLPGDPGWIW